MASHVSASTTAYAWYSPSETYIQMQKVEPSVENETVQISLQFEFGKNVTSPDVNLIVRLLL